MTERRLGVLYFLAFIALILIVASPFAASVYNLLAYVAIPLFLVLSVLGFYSWKRQGDLAGRKETSSTWPGRIETFLRKLPPF